jgi:serine/threonine protein kinase
MLSTDPEKRITIKEIFEDEWFKVGFTKEDNKAISLTKEDEKELSKKAIRMSTPMLKKDEEEEEEEEKQGELKFDAFVKLFLIQ